MSKMITLEEAKHIRLSENFTLDEFLYSDTAIRLGIDNSIPERYIRNIQYLVDTILQPLRNRIGPIRILSGYRSPELSIKLGSSTHSNHCFGLAADIEPYKRETSLTEILTYIEENCNYKELIAEYFPYGWVHVAAQQYNNRHILKLKDHEHNYAHVNKDYILKLYPNHKTTRAA